MNFERDEDEVDVGIGRNESEESADGAPQTRVGKWRILEKKGWKFEKKNSQISEKKIPNFRKKIYKHYTIWEINFPMRACELRN